MVVVIVAVVVVVVAVVEVVVAVMATYQPGGYKTLHPSILAGIFIVNVTSWPTYKEKIVPWKMR